MSSAATLSARLIKAAVRDGIMRVLPFWADGGSGSEGSPLAPAGHVLAAYPTSVVRARVEDLGPGGLVGYLRQHLPPASTSRLPLVVVLLGYDAGRAATGHESVFARPRRARVHPHDALADVLIARYDGYFEAPTENGPWTAVGDTRALEAILAPTHPADANSRGGHASEPIFEDRDQEDLANEFLTALPDLADPSELPTYHRGFRHILKGVEGGDYYQVNLARRLEARIENQYRDRARTSAAHVAAAAQRLHRALRAIQPTAFGALLPVDEDTWIISGSPECLLEWRSDSRIAKSFPIKGTIARSALPQDDILLSNRLLGSAKDQAEHVMIVDLVRNDLGRVAEPGSVHVAAILSELALRTVRHLVAEVSATVSEPHDLADVIGAVFPGGSITGAPKIAAMQALDAWETFARGFYCGSLGVLRGGHRATLSILIRTGVLSADGLTYGTGGGLVADSVAAKELAETELKAAAINAALASARTPKTSAQ